MEVWGEKKKKTSGTRVSFDIQSAFPNTCVKKVLNKDSNVNEPIKYSNLLLQMKSWNACRWLQH